MRYKMYVTITDPDVPKGTLNTLNFALDWVFSRNEKTYGNGYYARVKGEGFESMGFDLRYENSFDKNNKEKWLEEWAKGYWSGEKGSWKVEKLEIKKI